MLSFHPDFDLISIRSLHKTCLLSWIWANDNAHIEYKAMAQCHGRHLPPCVSLEGTVSSFSLYRPPVKTVIRYNGEEEGKEEEGQRGGAPLPRAQRRYFGGLPLGILREHYSISLPRRRGGGRQSAERGPASGSARAERQREKDVDQSIKHRIATKLTSY